MSRWFADEVIASNRVEILGTDGKKTKTPQVVAPLRLKFRDSFVMLFGEGTPQSIKYHAYIDGKIVEHAVNRQMTTEFDAAKVAGGAQGNTHFIELIAQNLDSSVEQTLEIEPLFVDGKEGEIRIESVCIAVGTSQAGLTQ